MYAQETKNIVTQKVGMELDGDPANSMESLSFWILKLVNVSLIKDF